MSTGIIFDGDVLDQGIQTKTQMTFNYTKTKPKLTRRYLSFQKTKPSLDYFSLIKTIRNPKELISNTEIILSQRTYYPNKTYNNEIKSYQSIKTNQKLYKTYRVKQIKNENQSSQISDAPLYIEHYLMNRVPQCKISNTIYTELTKRKNEYLDKLIQSNENLINQQDLIQEAKKRKHCIKVNHPNTNYHDMKKIDFIPVVNHVPCNQEYVHGNISEMERFRRSTEQLLKLKELINNNPDLCNALLKEYIWRHGIYDDEYYRISKLINLNNYLNSTFKIDPKKSMKELLIKGLNYFQTDCNENTDNNNQIKKKIQTVTRDHISYLRPIKNKKLIKDEATVVGNIITDMNLQNNLYNKKKQRTELDIINQPDEIVNLLQNEFIEEQPKDNDSIANVPIPSSQLGLSMKKKIKNFDANKPKTASNTIKIYERLYQKKKATCDYDLIKKHNKLLEYVCYIKAKNNLQYLHLKEQFMFKKGLKTPFKEQFFLK